MCAALRLAIGGGWCHGECNGLRYCMWHCQMIVLLQLLHLLVLVHLMLHLHLHVQVLLQLLVLMVLVYRFGVQLGCAPFVEDLTVVVVNHFMCFWRVVSLRLIRIHNC